jgi:ABC-type nitrate/sulfonate/bicarbonate transport system substrate-binding protein
LPFSGTVINRNWAAKNGPVVQRILSAHSKSVAWFYDPKNRAEAVAMMAEASKIKTEDEGVLLPATVQLPPNFDPRENRQCGTGLALRAGTSPFKGQGTWYRS